MVNLTKSRTTNITVSQNGSVNKLLSIRPKKSSQFHGLIDYIIILPKRKFIITETCVIDSYNDDHISIHDNPDKYHVTITRKVNNSDIELINQRQLNPGLNRDNLYIPMFYSIIGNKLPSVVHPKTKDTYYKIADDYDVKIKQLHFMVLLSNLDVPSDFLMNKIDIPIGKYKITILWIFSNVIYQNQFVFRFFQTTRESYESLIGNTPEMIEQTMQSLLIDTTNRVNPVVGGLH